VGLGVFVVTESKTLFMKKSFYTLAILLCFLTLTSNAQLQKGHYLIGGDLANFDFSLNSGNAFIMNITPKVAWFIRDNVAVGAFVDFGLSTAKGAGTTVNYGVGPLARYYFPGATGTVARITRLFLEGNVGIEGVNPAHGGSTNGLGLGVGPGLAYFVTDDISLEALFKYTGLIGFGSDPTSSRLQLGLGFQVYLPGSKVKAEMRRIENK
jgi:hypothetical protein